MLIERDIHDFWCKRFGGTNDASILLEAQNQLVEACQLVKLLTDLFLKSNYCKRTKIIEVCDGEKIKVN